MAQSQHDRPGRWSNIEDNFINLEKLQLLCSHERALRMEGYVISQLKPDSLLAKLRCENCAKRMKPPRAANASQTRITENETKTPRKRDLCEYHPGRVRNLHFTCCQAHVSVQKGCQLDPSHKAPDGYLRLLQQDWTYYHTPVKPKQQSPSHNKSNNRRNRPRFHNLTLKTSRTAVALDCEFGISFSNEPELIRLTAVDFFTKQVLVDSLVKPDVGIKNYVTKYSGVTAVDMRNAVRTRKCIFRRDAARDELLKFVDSETILVMHGGSSDMTSLRWIHPHILDTFVLETYFESMPGGRSLKNLCDKKLGLKIQSGKGHDSHEDALACRELAIWIMNMIPEN